MEARVASVLLGTTTRALIVIGKKAEVRVAMKGAVRDQKGSREVQLYSFFNLGTRWMWVVNATPDRFNPGKRPASHCIRCWVDPRTVLDGCGKFLPYRDSIPGPSSQ